MFDKFRFYERILVMITSFLSSIKYTGYFFPLAFVRIIFGYIFIQTAIERIGQNFLEQPQLARAIEAWVPYSSAPFWYIDFLETVALSNWKLFAYGIICFEFLIGFSFVFGFLVRPVSILGLLYSVHFVYAHPQPSADLYSMYFLFFTLALWMGAGRCLGLDAFFYKRQRGLIW